MVLKKIKIAHYGIATLAGLFSLVSVPSNATEALIKNAIDVEKVNSTSDYPRWLDDINFKSTLFYRNYNDETIFGDSTLALVEASYASDDFEMESGVAYESKRADGLVLNSLSFKQFLTKSDYTIGKFVSPIGVMDYLSTMNVFNIPRVEYYDEPNPNVRYVPAWMGRLNVYPNEETTTSIIFQPYDEESTRIIDSTVQFGLNSGVPFILTHTGNEDLDLIGNAILVPVYENSAKSVVDYYIDYKRPEVQSTPFNTSMGVNYMVNKPDYTYGVFYLNALTRVPLITVDENLITAVNQLTDKEDKQQYLDDYTANLDNEPIKSIEYFRYNLLGLYSETTLGSFGLRGEISYRDKFPLLNATSNLSTLGLGLDHKGWIYNNFEMQYLYFSERDIRAYYGVWVAQFDPLRIGEWKMQFKNTLAYGIFDESDITTAIPSLTFSYKKMDIALEYLAHSREEYAPDSAILSLKVAF